MERSKLSLLDLPPEIRLMIYEYLFEKVKASSASAGWPSVSALRKGRYRVRPALAVDLSIILCNRLIYEETIKVLYCNTELVIESGYLSSPKYQVKKHWASLVQSDSVHLLHFITGLELFIELDQSVRCRRLIRDRLRRLVKAIDHGKHLKKLSVKFIWARDPAPILFSHVLEVLKPLRMSGEAKVEVLIRSAGLFNNKHWYVSTGTDENKAACMDLGDIIKGLKEHRPVRFVFWKELRSDAMEIILGCFGRKLTSKVE